MEERSCAHTSKKQKTSQDVGDVTDIKCEHNTSPQFRALTATGPWINDEVVMLRLSTMQEILCGIITPSIAKVLKRKARALPVKCMIRLHSDLHLIACNGLMSCQLTMENEVEQWFGTARKRVFKAQSYALITPPVKIHRQGDFTVIEFFYAVYTAKDDLIWPEFED